MAQSEDCVNFLHWFKDQLSDERLKLEARHRNLLYEVEVHLRSMFAVPVEPAEAKQSEIKDRVKVIGLQDDSLAADTFAVNDHDVTLAPLSQDCQDSPVTSQLKRLSTFEAQSVASRNFVGDDELREAENCIEALVMSKRFEFCFGGVIVVNMLVMAIEAQYNGLGVGYDIAFTGYTESKEKAWNCIEAPLHIIDYVFGAMYTFELALKVIGLRMRFFNRWNIVDAVIVLLWYFEMIASNVTLPIDMMILRILRLARLLRLIKLAKSIMSIAGFEELFLILTALKGSVFMLTWTALVLFGCLVTFAFLLNQTLLAYVMENNEVSLSTRRNCFKYFGTFSRSVFSMFELTLANWIPIGRFLMEDVNEFLVVFVIIYKLTFGFSVIAVINGCFIKETFKTAEDDDLLMVLQKEKQASTLSKKMLKFMEAADWNRDGRLSQEEFVAVCQNLEVKSWLAALGLDVSDAIELYQLLDDGSGDVAETALIKGVAKLQGPARSLDLAFESKVAAGRQQTMMRALSEILRRLKSADCPAMCQAWSLDEEVFHLTQEIAAVREDRLPQMP